MKKFKLSTIKPWCNKNLSMLLSCYQIQAIADSMLSIFSVIFLYKKLDLSLVYVLAIFLIDSILCTFGFVFGAKILSKIGIKKSIIIGSLFFMINYASFLLFDFNTTIAIIIYLVSSLIGRSFYWTGYHVNFSLFTDKEKRGSQIGRSKNILAIIGVLLPFASSMIIDKLGFNILFVFAVLIYIISLIPLLKMDDVKQDYSFGFFETFKNIFSKKYIRNFFIGFSEGGEALIKVVVWPMIMFLFMNNDISSIGILMSLVLLTTLLLNFFIGKISDTKNKSSIIKLGGFIYGFGWIGKMLSLTNVQLFIFLAYQNMVEPILRVPYESRFYESIGNKGDMIDEHTVMREVSNFIGRTFVLIVVILIVMYLPNNFNLSLIIAAVLSILMGLLTRNSSVK